jgi:monoamine oxidase
MPDVLILGAGMAGLSVALELARSGLRVEVLEARERIGGRIFSRHDSMLNHPVELGAEFVHGMPPEIWLPAQRHNLKMIEVEGDLWCSLDGRVQACNFFPQADKIQEEMSDSDPDESFLDFLARKFPGDDHAEAKRWATGYVSGFNAADPAEVSVHWLVHSREAEEQINGDRSFRIAGSYRKLLDIFATELAKLKVPIHLNTVVTEVRWSRHSVQIETSANRGGTNHIGTRAQPRSPDHGCGKKSFTAPRALVSFSLGVLQSGCIRFTPELPSDKKSALDRLAMGKVVRVVLCLREPLWKDIRPNRQKSLANLSFLFSQDRLFPTWWTQMPEPVPMITGWAPAHAAEQLAGISEGQIIDQAVGTLASLLHIERARIQALLSAAYFHDWNSDPFSRGAYSYVKVGGEGSQKILGAPVDGTLFFAGEATDTSGNNGTVHAAIASANRAAHEILAIPKSQ